MGGFWDTIGHWNDGLQKILIGLVVMGLLVAVGVYLTIRTRGFQFTHFFDAFRKTLGSLFGGRKKQRSQNGVTPFQAVTTALAGTMGTGNIVGVATAIVAGGPGAVLWMWVSAFFGMITKYAEVFLAVHFREKDETGQNVGGPMYYLSRGLHSKWLAVIFALFCALASFGIGNATQSNSIAQALDAAFHIPTVLTGIICAVLVGVVILGGVRRIAGVTEKIIPFISIVYILGSVAALCINFRMIPDAFGLIFRYAFNFRAFGGGAAGYVLSNAIRYGFSRGIFSNEAGLGSAPIAHGAADTDSPVRQGMWGIFEVFLDTIVVCTLTTLVILTSGIWDCGLNGAALTTAAYGASLGGYASIFIAVSTALFAFATLVGWSYYGERCVSYLFHNKRAVTIYRVIYVLVVFLGAVMELNLVWNLSDTLNGLMALPNLVGIVGLSPLVIRMTREYHRTGKLPPVKK